MDSYDFPSPPFVKGEIQEFAAALHADLRRAEAEGEDPERLKNEQENQVYMYAESLSDDLATEFLLMYSAERLFLMSEDPPAPATATVPRPSPREPIIRDPRISELVERLRNLIPPEAKKLMPAAVGITIGFVIVLIVVLRVKAVFFS